MRRYPVETIELYYPQIAAQAGGYTFDKGIEIEIYSAKSSYFDWAKIRFTEQFRPKISLARKAPGSIQMGYNGSLDEVFSGFVSKKYDGGAYINEVNLKDEMLLLEETIINDTFLNTTPQEMISYFLAQAGLSKMKLASKSYPRRKMLPIREQSVVQAINTVNAAWGLKVPFFFSGGTFYWDEKPEQSTGSSFRAHIVSHATGVWLDLKMADYSKKRKKAQKARGYVTVTRLDMEGEAIKIAKGQVFKTRLDINGEELRFFSLEPTVLQKGARTVDVLVEAETEGARYNVPPGQITKCLTYIDEVAISNGMDWIIREGSDTEDDDSARTRTLRSWSELAQRAIETHLSMRRRASQFRYVLCGTTRSQKPPYRKGDIIGGWLQRSAPELYPAQQCGETSGSERQQHPMAGDSSGRHPDGPRGSEYAEV